MAKGSFNGVITGKKGNTVFYRLKNSNNAEKQGWREYNAKVSNPQSDGQIDQRVKLQAVNNLYRALKPIIQRGWENHKYGDESRRAFLKLALGASFDGPYIEKGSTLAVPIKNVPIMYGSLSPVQMECDSGWIWFMNITVDGDSYSTVGDISQLFIKGGLAQEGDQVTIVLGYLTELGMVSYKTISFYVNTSDETSFEDTFGLVMSAETFEDIDRLVIFDVNFPFNLTACCALCSISRDGDNTNLRSYAEFAMSDAFESYFYGNAATKKAAAKASYIKTRGAHTNWEQVPDSDIVLPVGTTHAMLNSATPAQVQVNAYRMQNGYLQVYDNTNSIWRYVYCMDVKLSQYHMWLTSDKVTGSMWSGTAPTGAVTTDAIRMQSSSDANAADLEFDAWLVDNGYNPRFIYGNIPA